MRVIDINNSNVFNFVLRDYSTNEVYDYIMTNENNGEVITTTLSQSTATIKANLDQFTVTLNGLDYNEGGVYAFKILDNANNSVLHRGKLFCTADIPQNYSINE